MKELGILIWGIGILFSIGLFFLSESIEEEKWWFKAFVLFACFTLWPLLLGKLVGIGIEERDKQKEELDGVQSNSGG